MIFESIDPQDPPRIFQFMIATDEDRAKFFERFPDLVRAFPQHVGRIICWFQSASDIMGTIGYESHTGSCFIRRDIWDKMQPVETTE
jgi:hypothetical protein